MRAELTVRVAAWHAVLRPAAAAPDWFDPEAHLGRRGHRYFSEGTRRWLAACLPLLASGAVQAGEPGLGMAVGSHGAGDHTLQELHRTLATEGVDGLSPMLAPGFCNNTVAGQGAIRLQARRFNATLTTPGVAGLDALVLAARELRAGRCEAALAGAVEEPAPVPAWCDGALAVVLRAGHGCDGFDLRATGQAFLPPGAGPAQARRAVASLERQHGMPTLAPLAALLGAPGAEPAARLQLLLQALGVANPAALTTLAPGHGALEPLHALLQWLQARPGGTWLFLSADGHLRTFVN